MVQGLGFNSGLGFRGLNNSLVRSRERKAFLGLLEGTLIGIHSPLPY